MKLPGKFIEEFLAQPGINVNHVNLRGFVSQEASCQNPSAKTDP